MAKRAHWYAGLDFEALTSPEATLARRLLAGFDGPAAAVKGWPEEHRFLLRPLGLPAPLPPEPAWPAVADEALLARLPRSPAEVDRWLADAELTGIAGTYVGDLGLREVHPWTPVRSALASREAPRVAAGLLRLRAARLGDLREQHAAESWRGTPPAELPLKRAWALARSLARHTALRGPAHIAVAVEGDPPALAYPGGRLELDGPRLVGRQPTLAHAYALVDALTHPDHAPLRAALLQALRVPAWQRALAALDRAIARPPLPESEDKRELGWVVDPKDWSVGGVLCREKKRGGGYVTRAVDAIPLGVLTDQDERVATLSDRQRVAALVGHPRVFLKHPEVPAGQPVRVRSGALAVRVAPAPGGLALALSVGGREVPADQWEAVAQGGAALFLGGEIWSFESRFSAREVAAMLADRGAVVVPPEGYAQLAARLPELAAYLPVDADPAVLGRAVDGDSRPLVRFTRTDAGVDVEIRVQPLPEVAAAVPGEGSDVCVAARDGGPVHVRRDREAELREVAGLVEALGLGAPAPGERFRWAIEELPRAVDVVDRARAAADRLRPSWSGDRIRLASRALDPRDLRLRVRAGRDWFGLDGDVTIDGQSVRLGALLEAALEGHAHVMLSDGQWAALSEGLRTRLASAAAVSDGEEAALGPQHAALVDALQAEGAEVEAPPAWFALTRRSREARDLDVPVPADLGAALRAYQAEGFAWLARLAHWAPGAVLADDMGLGKTLQALALLLHRRDRPSLVVAPTSVVANWAREAARFAPALRVRLYHGGGRSLDGLGPGDLVLTSYGVLVRDGEALAACAFGTAVLDEAHAIANPASQRARAAFGLDVGFRLALTGTPVENRVEDLWSLFRFVSPGLLGSESRFAQRFVGPIARGDRERRALLARVVAPFLLRRTKGEVARDLPARSELRVDVVLSAEERALYDRARLAAVARLQSAKNATFQVFEELLRLRKLACHPALEDPGSPVASSKLQAVVRALRDLRESGHKALVFSSFTSHLALVRAALEAEGFRVRYLDGALTARQRLVEVDAFQAGEGDVFLISLKAGGVGLNLTAATYVLHLDPWWNPAAEDQATDRAHRIGQDRPVTVLRFVSLDTVEAQIVALQGSKRELADALLEASGEARTVTADQLLALLAEVDAAPAPVAAAPRPAPAPLRLAPPPPPSAPPPPAPPSAPLPPSAPASPTASVQTVTRVALLAALDAGLADLLRAGTRRSYQRALANLLAWLPAPDPLAVASLPAARDTYLEAVARGEVPGRSDLVYLRPALGRALAGLGGG